MRVIVEASGAGEGGISRVLKEVISNWSPDDELAIISAPPGLVLGDEDSACQLRVLSRQSRRRSLTILSSWARTLRESFRADAVLSISPSLAVVGSRAPVVTVFHDLLFVAKPDLVRPIVRLYRSLAYRCALRASTVTLTVSSVTARSLRTWSRGGSGDVPVVKLSGQLPTEPTGLPAALSLKDKAGIPLLITPGHAMNKGASTFLSALSHVGEPWNAVVLAGKSGLGPRWEKMALDLGISSNVTVLSWVSDGEYAALLDRASLLVMLSEYEGFGLPALEAIYRGARVLISEDPALQEVCEGRATVARSEDPREVAADIMRALVEGPPSEVLKRTWGDVAREMRQFVLKSAGQLPVSQAKGLL